MIKTFGPIEEQVQQQMDACLAGESGALGALMGDNHLGYSMPIGGVVGYAEHVSPSAVGYDIACGNCAVRTDRLAASVDREAAMDLIWSTLSFGIGRKNNERVESPVLDDIRACAHPFQRGQIDKAAQQLGTIGSGNHYVDLFEDEDGWLWVGVHFGSRGFGHGTATWALEQAGAKDAIMAPPCLIPASSELGELYIDGMERAGRYAYAGRDWVVDRVCQLLGAQVLDRVHNHHNFAWREEHAKSHYWVHRKGATPAYPGQRGFVGATMGEPAVILEGIDSIASREALRSTVHGAGRVMSRTKAAGKTKTFKQWSCGNRECARHGNSWPMREFNRGKNNELPKCPECGSKLHSLTTTAQVSEGLVNYPAWQEESKRLGIALRGGGADEAPACYKRLDEVLSLHAGTVRILHTLKPIGVAMAGKDVFDPFKD